MNRLFVAIFFCFFLTACSQKGAVPKNVLSPHKMEAVLWDALMADETAEYYIQKDSSINALTKHADLYEQVYQIHKISKEEFKRSLRFYESHPKLLKPIFDSLQKRTEKVLLKERPVREY